jgi:uncharacterized protein YggU (UPF0235/DUF167 family)
MSLLNVSEHPEGSVLPIRARPGARRNKVVDVHDGALRVDVVAAPEKGKANDAIIALLASELNLRKSQFEQIAGLTSRDKKFVVTGVTPDELRFRVESVLEPTMFFEQPPE